MATGTHRSKRSTVARAWAIGLALLSVLVFYFAGTSVGAAEVDGVTSFTTTSDGDTVFNWLVALIAAAPFVIVAGTLAGAAIVTGEMESQRRQTKTD